MIEETFRSRALYERACAVTPGGVNSPVRAMRSVGREHPLFVTRGAGSQLWDADGNRYTDWVMSWGALPLGHADPDVTAAVEAALRDGASFGAPTPREVELAELVCEAVPSMERVRFVSSGTEATMSALRVARAATGRDGVLMFAGCYHGHSDSFLASAGSGLATLSLPSSPGVPTAVTANTLVAEYNDLESAERLVRESGVEIGAIIVEPVAANMGVVPATERFLQGLRALCDRIGAVLIFDEVITGFRLCWGGAQSLLSVTPDLTCLGKVIGGGFPVGAFGGRAELMELVAPAGGVYQAGTLSGNPLAMASGIATLRALRDRSCYPLLDRRGERLASMLRDVIADAAADSRLAVSRVGSLVTLFHLAEGATRAPRNFTQARACDTDAFAITHGHALDAGHVLPASQFEAWFVSTAHTEADLEGLTECVAQRAAAWNDDRVLAGV